MKYLLIFMGLCSVAMSKKALKLIEGDIMVDQETQDIMDGKISAFDAKVSRKWPNGIIPYEFTWGFDKHRAVEAAIADYNKFTCVKFVKRRGQKDYLRLVNRGGCSSFIGMAGGAQDVTLGRGCGSKAIVIHELMHAAGFYHEQSRYDRDNYVTINWNNIVPNMRFNFNKYSHGQLDTLGERYDYDSVMHYAKYAFSRNRQPTIVAKNNPGRQLGQYRGFSAIDIKQINKLYRCNGVKPSPGGGTSCVDNNPHCMRWARGGECYKNPRYMLAYCQKSCKRC